VFRVDLHVHTRHSGDNAAEPEAMVEAAMARGLHGIAFTEHYFFDASEHALNLAARYAGRIAVYRGVEYSTAEGHCLVFGADTDRLARMRMPLSVLVREVAAMGGVVIPSHPFRGGSGVGELIRSVAGLCAVEGMNGANLHSMNVRATEMARTMGLPVCGGSDAHAPEEVGSCYTEFSSSLEGEAALVAALRAGAYTACDARRISRLI
jgi:hypothetical protein